MLAVEMCGSGMLAVEMCGSVRGIKILDVRRCLGEAHCQIHAFSPFNIIKGVSGYV